MGGTREEVVTCAFVGDKAGSTVGSLVGSTVGTPVGRLVSFIFGSLVGNGDGRPVGLRVEIRVGLFVGKDEGTGVVIVAGRLDGAWDDKPVGLKEGVAVGLFVGTNEGVFVGYHVTPFSVGRGETVGARVGFGGGARVGFVCSGGGSSQGPGVGNFEGGRFFGETLGDRVGYLDGILVGDFVVGVAVVGGMVGDCVGLEVGLPMFLSGSTMTLKDDEKISTKLIVIVSSEFSSTKIAPLKSPGRKVSGSLKGKSRLFINPMRSAFSFTDRYRRRNLTAKSLIETSRIDGSAERVKYKTRLSGSATTSNVVKFKSCAVK